MVPSQVWAKFDSLGSHQRCSLRPCQHLATLRYSSSCEHPWHRCCDQDHFVWYCGIESLSLLPEIWMKYACTTNYPAFNISAPMDSMDSLENVPPAARLIRPTSEGTSWYRTSPDGWDRMASITRYHKGIIGHHKAKAAISQNGVFVSRHPKMEFFDVFCQLVIQNGDQFDIFCHILPYSASCPN